MSFLSKLFGGKGSPEEPFEMSPTAEMMDEDRYWQIIADSIDESGGNQECQLNVVVDKLEQLSPKDMVGFRLRTDKLLYDTYNSEMWCAAYVMNGGCSDDAFEYFRLWMISQGREIYEKAKADPDSLASISVDDLMGQDFWFEPLWYVANDAFKKKTGKDLYDYIDYDNFTFTESRYPQFEFTWTEGDEESMRKICPNLFEKYWNKH